jgi:pimeloyl-ACP methyl ester carboxylesterase
MRTRNLVFAAILTTATLPAIAQTQPAPVAQPIAASTASPKPQSGYAAVNGLEVYYEIHGQGKPMIVLHGGITATEQFAGNIREWARTRQVIALHAQGHGQTRDIDRPYRYEALADDVAAVAGHLKLQKVDLVGYSFGGAIALQTAIRHPELVDRLVVISTPMARNGFHPEVIAAFEQMPANASKIAANIKASPLAAMYPKTHWEASFGKMGELQSRDYDWSRAVQAIKAPTLLVFADADAVRLEHIAAFYKALGGGQRDAGLDGSMRSAAHLAVVPGATHYNIAANPVLASFVGAFLDK